MNLVFIVYLLGLVEKGNTTLGVVFAISLVATVFTLLIKGIGYQDFSYDAHKKFSVWVKRFLFSALSSGLLFTLIPTKEISYAMLAAYGVEEIVTNDKVQEIGGKSLELLEKTLDEYLAEQEED